MNFKQWLEFVGSLGDMKATPPERRRDLIKGGEGGCPEMPMGVRAMCQPTTSAFQTYKKKSKR